MTKEIVAYFWIIVLLVFGNLDTKYFLICDKFSVRDFWDFENNFTLGKKVF